MPVVCGPCAVDANTWAVHACMMPDCKDCVACVVKLMLDVCGVVGARMDAHHRGDSCIVNNTLTQ